MGRVKANRGLLEWVDSIIFAIVILALVFTFGVRVVQVDGSSMNPGLVDGERLLLSSLPYEPEYGDVVVIDSYTGYGKLLIKRVIGKGGDVIDIDFEQGIVYRNGEALDEPYTADKTYLSAFPFIGESYSGTGDLFASVIAGGRARAVCRYGKGGIRCINGLRGRWSVRRGVGTTS